MPRREPVITMSAEPSSMQKPREGVILESLTPMAAMIGGAYRRPTVSAASGGSRDIRYKRPIREI